MIFVVSVFAALATGLISFGASWDREEGFFMSIQNAFLTAVVVGAFVGSVLGLVEAWHTG